MSDKQAVASGAMLKTLSTLTGYDVDQLPTFFNSLSQISVNPLQMADPRAISTTGSQRLDAESDIAPGIDDASVRVVPGEDFSEKVEAKDEVASGEDFSEKDEAKDEVASDVDSSEENEVREKLASGEDLAKENDTKERLVSNHESLEKTAAKEGVAPEDDASKEDDVKKEKF